MATTCLLVTLAVFVAQPYPDLSGTWMVIGDRSVTTDTQGRTVHARLLGEMFVVRQAGAELTLVLDNGNGLELQHRVDGIETVKERLGPTGHMIRATSRAVWEGSRLTITQRLSAADAATVTTALILTLLPDGTLHVEAKDPKDLSMVSVYGRIR